MVDRVKPLKIESFDTGGTENDDFPTSVNKNEDYIDCRGVVIQNDSSDNEAVILSRDVSDNMTFADGVVSGTKTLSDLLSGGMSEETHRTLDTLTHLLNENYYEEYTRSGLNVTNITVWTDSGKTTKIREEQYSYSGNKVTQEVIIQYNSSGVETERLTIDHVYSGWKLSNSTAVRT